MKAGFSIIILFCVALLLSGFVKLTSVNDPWTEKQLMKPADLVSQMNSEDIPVIFNLGPSGSIKGSIALGSANESQNLEKFRKALQHISKEKKIVIYCGCCPFEKCPNIRPAFSVLTEMNFSRAYLLDLPANLKTDWIDKGYPLEKE